MGFLAARCLVAIVLFNYIFVTCEEAQTSFPIDSFLSQTKPRDTCNLEHFFSYKVSSSVFDINILTPSSIYDFPPKKAIKFYCRTKCYGLGDVLHGLVSMVLLAVFSNHKVEIDIHRPPLHKYYDYPAFVVDEPIQHARSFHCFNHQKTDRIGPLLGSGEFDFDPELSYIAESNAKLISFMVSNNSVFLPKFRKVFKTYDEEKIMGCVLRFLFNPRPEVLNPVATLLDRVKKDDILIGLHIRAGDKKKLNRRTPNETIVEFLGCYQEHLGDKAEEYYTYLAVDNEGMYDLVEKNFNSSRILTYQDKGFPGHSDKCVKEGTCKYVHERTVVEHHLLSRVDSMIHARSGFSTTAAYMGGLYGLILLPDFCDCVKGRDIEEFMEIRNGKKVPIWTTEKCQRTPKKPSAEIESAFSSKFRAGQDMFHQIVACAHDVSKCKPQQQETNTRKPKGNLLKI